MDRQKLFSRNSARKIIEVYRRIDDHRIAVVIFFYPFLNEVRIGDYNIRPIGADFIPHPDVVHDKRNKFFDTDVMDRIYEKFKQLGFMYTALDLRGYRTGSMNEVINAALPEK